MAHFGLILFCLLVGFLLARARLVPQMTAAHLNRYVIWVALPALILGQVHGLIGSNRGELFSGPGFKILVFTPWLVFGILALGALWQTRGASSSTKASWGSVLLCAGLGNTSFLGLPLLAALRGEQGVRLGVIADQLGTFFILATLGVISAGIFSPRRPSGRQPGRRTAIARGLSILTRVFKFPPFVALLVAFGLGHFRYPELASELLSVLASTLVPTALVAVGLRLRFDWAILKRRRRALVGALAYKLVLAPALILTLFRLFGVARSEALDVAVLQAAMAPMITGAVVAAEFELDTELAELLLAVGIPLSLLSVPAWDLLLKIRV